MSQPEPFDHEVSVDIASLIPEDIRDDPGRLKDWVDRALKIGLMAMIEGSGSVDLSFVNKAFEGWKDDVSGKLIGKESDFEEGLETWLTDPEGTFQKAFDLDDETSPLGKFKKNQKESNDTHHSEVEKLIKDLLKHLGYESGVADEEKKGTQKGTKFELEIDKWLNANAKVMNDDIGVVGAKNIKGSGGAKTGDVLIEVDDAAAKKLRITIEAKSGLSKSAYYEKVLKEEIAENMKLRKAQAGIGVVDINNPNKTHEPFIRWGQDRILVAVDRERKDFTLLKVAYHLLRRQIIHDELEKKKGEGATKLDLVPFEDRLTKITDRLKDIKGMRGNLTRAKGILDVQDEGLVKIKDDIDEDVDELLKLLRKAKKIKS
tara:strand:+ start:763 stop:1884 length:1122 start_codon:yes stop_codon:yes gene_type:complete